MNKKEIGQFILSNRIDQGLSQSDLAYKIGKRRQAVLEIEKSKVDFRIGLLLDIVHELGYKLEFTPLNNNIKFDFTKIKPAKS